MSTTTAPPPDVVDEVDIESEQIEDANVDATADEADVATSQDAEEIPNPEFLSGVENFRARMKLLNRFARERPNSD